MANFNDIYDSLFSINIEENPIITDADPALRKIFILKNFYPHTLCVMPCACAQGSGLPCRRV